MSDVFFSRPRVVWATQSPTPHDQRFIQALIEAGWSVVFLSVTGKLEDLQLAAQHEPFVKANPQIRTNELNGPNLGITAQLSDIVTHYQPKLIVAGPLTTVARDISAATDLPLIAISWGYDLLLDAANDSSAAAAAVTTIEHAARIHVDCEAGRRAAIQLGALPERVIEFPWGIDLEAFPLRAPPPPGSPLTVISARSMEPVYDVATTIRGFALLTRQRPQLGVRLTLVGSGSLENDLRSLASDLDIDSQIDWMGRLTEADLQRMLATSTVYVSSSTVDGSSVTLLQAMATGLPSVVSDVGGNGEWVRSGETGLLFTPGNANDLATRLEQAFTSTNLRTTVGMAARKEVEQRADWRVHRETLAKACEEVAGLA